MPLESSETLEEPTPAEIADACKGTLDPETCREIAAREDAEEALGVAFTALSEAGGRRP